nr:hypothetical protein [Phocaeicola vulgatus]
MNLLFLPPQFKQKILYGIYLLTVHIIATRFESSRRQKREWNYSWYCFFVPLMEGGSIYDLYTYEYAGVNPETGAAQWYMDEKDANGKVTGRTVTEDYTQASKYELGSTLPDFQGGFSTDFAYKGIDLSIATNFQIGGKIYDSMYSSFMHAGSNIGSNWHKDILNAWTPENKIQMCL